MNRIDFILEQIEYAKNLTKSFANVVESDFWLVTPEQIASNMNWQIGHILVSKYYNTIVCISGPKKELNDLFPLNDYLKWYGIRTKPAEDLDIKPSKEELLSNLKIIDKLTIQQLEAMEESELNNKILKHPNPNITTKGDVLNWCFNHQMWHNGQIALLKRILNTVPA